MASLKEMRNRIGSVKATQKITKAMQMVAAAKLRKAQDAAQNARPYAQRMAAVIARRESESMLIFQTALLAALRSWASGMPTASGSLPPNLLIVSTSSCGTEEDP